MVSEESNGHFLIWPFIDGTIIIQKSKVLEIEGELLQTWEVNIFKETLLSLR